MVKDGRCREEEVREGGWMEDVDKMADVKKRKGGREDGWEYVEKRRGRKGGWMYGMLRRWKMKAFQKRRGRNVGWIEDRRCREDGRWKV
jgi:hypothetical protein